MFNAASKTNRHWFSFSISGLCLWTSCPSKVLSALLCSKKWFQNPQGPVKRLEDTLWLQITIGARHRRRNGCENCGITQGRKAGARISATSAPVIIVTLPVHIPSTLPGLQVPAPLHCHGSNREAAQWTIHLARPSKSHRPKTVPTLAKMVQQCYPTVMLELEGILGWETWNQSGFHQQPGQVSPETRYCNQTVSTKILMTPNW